MRLYHSQTSPYVRKVMLLLEESGHTAAVDLVSVMGSPLDPGSLPIDRNPLGKIPALDRPEGPTLYDSRVICRYLDAHFSAGLYPEAPALWEVLTLEATADGILDAAVLMRYEELLRPADKRFPDWHEGQWQKVTRALDALESQWQPHLTGPLHMGVLAVGAALGYLDFRHGTRPWRPGRPHLTALYDRLSARPAFQKTAPPAA